MRVKIVSHAIFVLTENSTCHSACDAACKHWQYVGNIRDSALAQQNRSGKECQKIQNPGKQSPEKTPGAQCLPTEQTAGKTGNAIEQIDRRCDLRFPKLQLIEDESQDKQQHGRQQVRGNQGN